MNVLGDCKIRTKHENCLQGKQQSVTILITDVFYTVNVKYQYNNDI